MPELLLSFAHRINQPPSYPSPLMASRAGAWAAERGQYRIAQQLMGLAAALEAYELNEAAAPRPDHGMASGVAPHPFMPGPDGTCRTTVEYVVNGETRLVPCGGSRSAADAPTERIDVSGAVSVVTTEGHLIHPATGLCFSACPHASHKEDTQVSKTE